MPQLTFFTAKLRYAAISVDTAQDVDPDPTDFGISASVTVTPFIKNPLPHDLGEASAFDIRAATLTPAPAMLVLATIKARLDNGALMIRADPDRPVYSFANMAAFPTPGVTTRLYRDTAAGKVYEWTGSAYSEVPDFAPLRLVAQTPVLSLPEGAVLGYQLSFTSVAYPSATKNEPDLPTFSFAAPTEDVVLDLATVPRISRDR